MRTLRFWLGNGLVGYVVIRFGEGLIHLDLPVRLRLTVPVSLIVLCFSLLVPLTARWWPQRLVWRNLPILVLCLLSVAGGGAGATLFQPVVTAGDSALLVQPPASPYLAEMA